MGGPVRVDLNGDQGEPYIAIIGGGLQASRRIEAMMATGRGRLRHVVAPAEADAVALTRRFGGTPSCDWRQAAEDPDVDLVMVCTPPNVHAEQTIAALNAGKHVLCEKPLARTSAEAWTMVRAAEAAGRVLHCGFNHRFHRGTASALERLRAGEFGTVLGLRCAYGIAGRDGYEREWRANPDVVAGGQLMEQGIHVVDLARQVLGEVTEVTGALNTDMFAIAPLEDNAYVLLRHEGGAVTSIHSSLTQWSNLFRLEFLCATAVVAVFGLGASYGDQRVEISPHTAGAFRTETSYFRGGDGSWRAEWEYLLAAIERGAPGNGADGARAVELVEHVYAAAHERTWVRTAVGESEDLLSGVLSIVRSCSQATEVGPDEVLFTSGLLGSVDLAAIVAGLERQYPIRIAPIDIRAANFDSVRVIADLVRARC
jgi:predicted dehydrogenase/acyl carrier protein